MALDKVNYVDGETVITAENMNAIQDAIIALEETPAQGLTEDMKQALLQIARKVAYIDDQGQTYYQDLYDALYPPKTVVLITAVFEQGSTVIYDDTALDDLKQYLTVTAKYDDNTTAILADSAYTLSGLLEAGTSTVTVAYNGLTTTFTVNVTARPTLSSISAVYTQSGTVYDNDTLDSLKADLVVTATYSDSSTQTVPAADYTLSGTLTAGTSTITVSYSGKTTTFSVTVTDGALKPVPSGYTSYDWVQNTQVGGAQATNNGICIDTELDGAVYATIDKEIDCCFSASGVSTAQVSTSSAVYGMRAGTGTDNIPNSRVLFLQRRAATADPPDVPAWQVQYNGTASIWTQLVDNTVYTIITKNKNVYCNGDLIVEGLEGESYTPANITIALFGEHRDNYYALKVYAKIRHFIVRDADGKALAAMYPAKNSGGVSGMYDVIRNRFFTALTPAWVTCGND